jgi:hypothetical protein
MFEYRYSQISSNEYLKGAEVKGALEEGRVAKYSGWDETVSTVLGAVLPTIGNYVAGAGNSLINGLFG